MKLIGSLPFLFVLTSVQASDRPKWFDQDTKSKDGWTFYCEGDAPTEKEALALSQSECSRKMCLLFGVEVQYQRTSEETLKDAKTQSIIKETCPQVRIIGRIDKKKVIECDAGECRAFISQFYPMNEYLVEKKRLNNPQISPNLEKTIIVREGNETFNDPKACRADLRQYKTMSGVAKEARLQRVELLKRAEKNCAQLDYRNVDLHAELNGYLIANMSRRGVGYVAVTNELMDQPTLMEKIKFLTKIEAIDTAQSAALAQKLVNDFFESLYFVDNLNPELMLYELSDDRDVKVHPYMEELKNCRAHSLVIRRWPRGFTDDITVCVKNRRNGERECRTTSIVMQRAAYAGCICHLGEPERAGSCAATLIQHMNSECPLEMTEACFQSMSKAIAEEMKINLHPTAKE